MATFYRNWTDGTKKPPTGSRLNAFGQSLFAGCWIMNEGSGTSVGNLVTGSPAGALVGTAAWNDQGTAHLFDSIVLDGGGYITVNSAAIANLNTENKTVMVGGYVEAVEGTLSSASNVFVAHTDWSIGVYPAAALFQQVMACYAMIGWEDYVNKWTEWVGTWGTSTFKIYADGTGVAGTKDLPEYDNSEDLTFGTGLVGGLRYIYILPDALDDAAVAQMAAAPFTGPSGEVIFEEPYEPKYIPAATPIYDGNPFAGVAR